MAVAMARAEVKSADSRSRRMARLREEILHLKEEMHIKDARMKSIPAQRRPHYLPTERLAILELRAARGWSQAQSADHMLVTPATIASWMGRLDEEGPAALVQMPVPVNRFPDFVAHVVRRLKVLCPAMGKIRIAQFLARAGLHLGSTTVARMLATPDRPRPATAAASPRRRLRSTKPNQIWHIDLTTVPTACGFWVPWLPWALPQRWPFCWWVAVIVDHFSRRIMGFAVFTQNPTSLAVRQLLGRAIREAGQVPDHLITDQGTQFTDKGFRRWCRRRGIRQRFGAVGKYGSISVVAVSLKKMKSEAIRRILVPLDRGTFRHEVSLFVEWYNGHRPHSAFQGAVPDEFYLDCLPRSRAPRFEPRRRWPRGSPCAGPPAPARGRRGQRLALVVTHLAGRRHLPIVELKKAA
jgi:transposase InsO family protein